jgi:hypothetical protein
LASSQNIKPVKQQLVPSENFCDATELSLNRWNQAINRWADGQKNGLTFAT